MIIYTIVPESDIYHSLLLESSNDWDVFQQFDGRKLGDSWTPIPVKIYRSLEAGDFPSLASHVPVFSRRALQSLSPLIGDCIEALPLKNNVEELYAINVLDVVDCLDYSRSEFKYFSDGEIMDIVRYAFKADCIRDKHIFKVRESPLNRVLVSEEFKNVVEGSGLEGLIFRLVDQE